jgi:hypothetical protein
VIGVFTSDRVTFEYLGSCPGAACVRYGYEVPQEVSGYILKTIVQQATVGYHGTFDIDPHSADLIEITVIPTDLREAMPTACALRTRIAYSRTRMNAGEFIIPASTEKQYLSDEGSYSVNRILYEGCRQSASESALSFDATPTSASVEHAHIAPALPVAGAELRLRLVSTIDSETSSAGDGLEAALARSIRDTNGKVIPAGTVVRGHLA